MRGVALLLAGAFAVLLGASPNSAAAANVDLLSGANARTDGAAAADHAGASVSDAGDVNGDGRDDVIIGADTADPNGTDSGSSYVIYGTAGAPPPTLDLNALTQAQGFRIDGAAAGDYSGHSVAGAGDVNGDGRDDVIIGAPFAGNNGRSGSGSSYVIYGVAGTSQPNIDLAALTQSKGFRVDG